MAVGAVDRPGVVRVLARPGDDQVAGEGGLAAEALAQPHRALPGHEVGVQPAGGGQPQLAPGLVEQEDPAGGGRAGDAQRGREQGVEQVGHPQRTAGAEHEAVEDLQLLVAAPQLLVGGLQVVHQLAELGEMALALGHVPDGLQGVGDLAGGVAHRERDDLGVGDLPPGVEAGVDGGGRLAGAEGGDARTVGTRLVGVVDEAEALLPAHLLRGALQPPGGVLVDLPDAEVAVDDGDAHRHPLEHGAGDGLGAGVDQHLDRLGARGLRLRHRLLHAAVAHPSNLRRLGSRSLSTARASRSISTVVSQPTQPSVTEQP